jgi:amino acid transporter
MADTTSGAGLRRDAIGLREVLFQSITHMAPAAAVAFSIIVGAQFASGALPLSVVFALIACMFVAISIGQLAKHLPSAGGFATYASQGLHPSVGFMVAWGYALAEALVAPLLYLIFGNVVAGTLQAEYGWSYDTWWPIAAVAAALIVFLLGWFGVRVSAVAGTILGLFEILVFATLAVWLIVKAGDANTLSVFGTKFATVPGFDGMSGIVAGSVYCILAFIGFEAAAPLAEEARNPRRTVQIAVVAAAALIGVFYILTTYAAAVFFGPDRFAGFAAYGDGNPWQQLARDVWDWGWVLVFFAIINSAIANSNAGSLAATRTWYALGRNRILTSMLTETHPRWRSPYVGVFLQFALALAVALPLGFNYGPLTAFGLVGTIVTAVIVLIYITVNLSCIGYYRRKRRDEFSLIWHLIVPILGVLAFIPAIFTALGVGSDRVDFIAKLPWPLSAAGPAVGIWLGLGLIYMIYLLFTDRPRIRGLGTVFGAEEPQPTPPPAEGGAAATPEPEAAVDV